MMPLCKTHTGLFPFHYKMQHGRVKAVCSFCRQPREVWPAGRFPPLEGVTKPGQQEYILDRINEYLDKGGWVVEQSIH